MEVQTLMARSLARIGLGAGAHPSAVNLARAGSSGRGSWPHNRRFSAAKLAWAGVVALTALLTLGSLAAPIAGAATQTKFYDLAVAPQGQAYAGVPSPVVVTLTNDPSSTQGFGSAELTIGNLPQGAISIGSVSLPAWSASFASAASPVVKLTSQKGYPVAPGSSVSVLLTITAPAQGTITVASEVKQSNDFSGSGNDFVLLSQAGNPFTVAALSLQFTQEPPAVLQQSGPPKSFSYMCPVVTVQLEDSSGAAVDVGGVAVTIAPSSSSSPGLYYGTSEVTSSGITVKTNSSGQAIFGSCQSGLAATNIGQGYSLTATAGGSSVTSSTFSVVQAYVQCSGSCYTTVQSSATGTQGTVGAEDSGASFYLSATFGTGLQLACDSQVATVAADPLQATTSTSAASGTVTMTFPKSVVNSIPNNGTPFMPVCVGATAPFAGSNQTATSSTSSPYAYNLYPYEGLLYACDSTAYASYLQDNPNNLQICVSSYAKEHGGAETVVISTSSLGDPMFW